MKQFWRVVEKVARTAFYLDLALIVIGTFANPWGGDFAPGGYEPAGGGGALILAAVWAFAHDKRGGRRGDYY
jgi:hypothetical protein